MKIENLERALKEAEKRLEEATTVAKTDLAAERANMEAAVERTIERERAWGEAALERAISRERAWGEAAVERAIERERAGRRAADLQDEWRRGDVAAAREVFRREMATLY